MMANNSETGKNYMFRDISEFQEVYPTKEEREQALMTMSSEEIMHLARTGGIAQAKIYYAYFAREAEEREKNAGSRTQTGCGTQSRDGGR